MNKIKFFISIFILFLLINIFSIKAFYNNSMGEYLFNKGSYIDSIEYFSNNNTKEGIYNKANVLYKQKKYDESIKNYMSILSYSDSELEFRLNHNIGNNYYRLGEKEEVSSNKLSYWNKSIDYYRTGLDIKYDKETKQNLEYVLSKIKEQKKSDEKKESEDEKKESEDEKKGDKEEGNKGDKKEESGKKDGGDKEGNKGEGNKGDKKEESGKKDGGDKDGNKGEGYKGDKKEESGKKDGGEKEGKQGEGKGSKEGEGSEPKNNQITENQVNALKEYEKALQKEQKANANNFNKVYNENGDDDPFNNFFNNSLLNQGSDKKDW